MKLRKSSDCPKHAFWYFTSFFTLALSAVGIGILLFQVIDYFFPENLENYFVYSFQEGLKTGISLVVIAAPIYYLSTRYINRSLSRKDLDEDSPIRKWLTYLILFGTLVVSIVTLVTLLRSLLDGDYTTPFLLKVATVFLLSGTIFLYYFTDMKNKSETSRLQKNQIWTFIFFGIVLIPLAWSIFMIDSPSETRARREDDQVSSEITSLKYTLESSYTTSRSLPESLDDLGPHEYYRAPALENKNFEYHKLGEKEYEICADFTTDTKADPRGRNIPYSYGPGEESAWIHAAGHVCVPFSIPQYVLDTPPPIMKR